MSNIIKLVDNIINKHDQEKLESFGGHTIAHGRATRWAWARDDKHDAVFEIFRGGANEELIARVYRDREHDVFIVCNEPDATISTGTLEHVMAEMEKYLMRIHGEL
jgi:hypothetical protein